MYTCTRLGTPTRTRTCTHADTHGHQTQRSLEPRGHVPQGGWPSRVTWANAGPCLCPAPPPTPGHPPSLHKEGASPSRD